LSTSAVAVWTKIRVPNIKYPTSEVLNALEMELLDNIAKIHPHVS
jgi:hypothetical protein